MCVCLCLCVVGKGSQIIFFFCGLITASSFTQSLVGSKNKKSCLPLLFLISPPSLCCIYQQCGLGQCWTFVPWTIAQPGLTIISCCFLVSFPFIQVHNASLYHPSVIVTLEEYIWFSLSAALKRSVCSFLIRRTPHFFLSWKDRPTPFHSVSYIIRHGVALETYPWNPPE